MKFFGTLTEISSLILRRNGQALTVRPNQSTTLTGARDIQLPPGDANHVLVSASSTQTLSDKTLVSPIISDPVITDGSISGTTVTAESVTASGGRVGGTLNAQYEEVVNSGASETDLLSYEIPANTWATDGDVVVMETMLFGANNGNTKSAKIILGATTFLDVTSGTLASAAVHLRVTLMRTSSGAIQGIAVASGTFASGSAVQTKYTSQSFTLSSTITLKVTGTGGASNDIRQKLMTVQYFPSP